MRDAGGSGWICKMVCYQSWLKGGKGPCATHNVSVGQSGVQWHWQQSWQPDRGKAPQFEKPDGSKLTDDDQVAMNFATSDRNEGSNLNADDQAANASAASVLMLACFSEPIQAAHLLAPMFTVYTLNPVC